MSVTQCCDDCGEVIESGSLYCEDCCDKKADNRCENCDRVSPEDYGYCQDCERGDCGSCDYPTPDDLATLQGDHDEHMEYEAYLQDKLDAAGIDFVIIEDWADNHTTARPPEAPEANEADDLIRRLDAAREKKKAESDD